MRVYLFPRFLVSLFPGFLVSSFVCFLVRLLMASTQHSVIRHPSSVNHVIQSSMRCSAAQHTATVSSSAPAAPATPAVPAAHTAPAALAVPAAPASPDMGGTHPMNARVPACRSPSALAWCNLEPGGKVAATVAINAGRPPKPLMGDARLVDIRAPEGVPLFSPG